MFIHLAVSASIFADLIKQEKYPNILFSFAFIKDIKEVQKLNFSIYDRVIVDSGAFSAWSQGACIDINEYIQFCHDILRLKFKGKVYFTNLDVIPGSFGVRPTSLQRKESAKQGWANMLKMNAKNLKVIPVFHQHEDFKWLKKMIKHTDYVGISPANDVSMKQKLVWLSKCFAFLHKHRQSDGSLTKTHGFAVTGYKQLMSFPFFSVDSTTWIAGARFGAIPIYLQDEGKIRNLHWHKNRLEILNKTKIDMQLFKGTPREIYINRIVRGIRSFKAFQNNITTLWKKRGVK